MILLVLFFTLAFSLTFAVAAENFLLGKWLLSAYFVPSFYPTVINCNAEENPLPIAHAVKTLQHRTDNVRYIAFALHAYFGHMAAHCIFPNFYFLYAISLFLAPFIYYRRPIAILIENHPSGASPVTYKQYVNDKNAEMVPVLRKELGGLFTTPPGKETIVRALNMCNYDKDKTIESLKNNTTEVNRKDEQDNFFWDTHDNMKTINDYKTKRVERDEYTPEPSYREQSIFAEKLGKMLNEYRIPTKSVVFLSGNPLTGNEYATYCRVPPENDGGENPLSNTYEEWFDKHVSGSFFMTAISFGPINTIEYGIDASPTTKVCLLSQTWLWDKELSVYEDSKNALNNTEAAIRYTNHAWVSIHVSDETVYFDSDSPRYIGDTIHECIEDFEEKHGFMDSVSKEYLYKNAKFGTHELFFSPEEEDEVGYLQLPNFTSSIILLNPLSLLKYLLLRGNDVVLPMFPIRLNGTDVVMSLTASSIFITAPDNISIQRAVQEVILDTNMAPLANTSDSEKDDEGAEADDEESSMEEDNSIEEEEEEDLVTIETKKNV